MQQHAMEFFGAVFAFIGLLNVILPKGNRRGGLALVIGGLGAALYGHKAFFGKRFAVIGAIGLLSGTKWPRRKALLAIWGKGL